MASVLKKLQKATFTFTFENAKYTLSGAQLSDELLVWASLYAYDHWQTCINIS